LDFIRCLDLNQKESIQCAYLLQEALDIMVMRIENRDLGVRDYVITTFGWAVVEFVGADSDAA
jgi:hypothetical protein